MKKFLSAVLAALMVLTTIQFQAATANATTLSQDNITKTWTVNTSTTKTDEDVYVSEANGYLVYKVTASVAGAYVFYTTGSRDTKGYLLDDTLNVDSYIKYNDDNGSGSNCELIYYMAKNETVYFAVRLYNSSYYGSDYKFTVCVEPALTVGGAVLKKMTGVYDADGDGNCESDGYYVVGNVLSKATAVTIPSTYNNIPIVSIESSAFSGCDYITSLVVPSSIKTIKSNAFYECSNLKKVTISAGVKEIGDSVFDYCTALESVSLGSGLTKIGQEAFGNTRLKTVTIPASVTSIGEGPFINATSLTSISVNSGNANFKSVGGVLFSKDGKTLYQYPCGNTATSYTIPAGVETVKYHGFSGAMYLKKVTFASTVTSLGEYAFSNCAALTGVSLNKGLLSVGDRAFYHCYKLSSVTIPSTVTSLGKYAFAYTALVSMTIPASVTSLGSDAFYGSDELTSVIVKNDSMTFPSDDIISSYNKVTIYGNTGSTAETYANSYSSVTFVDLSAVDCSNGKHSYYVYKYKTAPTCTKTGTAYTKCAKCGASGSLKTLDKIEHNVINYATCAMCGQNAVVLKTLTLSKAVSGKMLKNDGSYNAVYKNAKAGNYKIIVSNPNYNIEFYYDVVDSTGTSVYKYGDFTIEAGKSKSINLDVPAGATIYINSESTYYNIPTEDYTFTLKLTCNHSAYSTKVVKPTYAAKGYTLHTCKTCGHTYKSNYTAKLTVAAPAIKSVTAGSGKLAIKWGKKSYTGYQVQIATNKKFTKNKQTVTIKKAKTVKTTIKGLKNKTKYYVRVRAYKTYKSKKYYSKWSAVKTQTTK